MTYFRFYRLGGKRLFDLVLAGFGLLLFALPMGLIAWKIRQESNLSAFFLQPRIGLTGREFIILKFRTMSEDKRITPFCHLLRKTAMDELPQLLNILKGDMSFVGPRPIIPEEMQDLDKILDGKRRLSVRSGLTGLAQLNSDKTPTLAERIKWDCLYVDRCSLFLDIRIILISVWVTFTARWEAVGKKQEIS